MTLRLILTLTILSAMLVGCGDDPRAPKNFGKGRLGTDDREPRPAAASTATHIPSEAELAAFRDMEYYHAHYRDVLGLMGHPKSIEQTADGSEAWVYPWGEKCLVNFDTRRYVESVDYTPVSTD